jgi:Immunoglobulin-like domain of bacterial spore germination
VSDHIELEDRLRTAVHAHAAGVEADDASLDSIRRRVRVAKHRRRTILAGAGIAAALAVAFAVPRFRDEGRVTVSNEPQPTVTGEPPPTTTAPPGQSSTTVAPEPSGVDPDQVLWPDPAGDLTTDPLVAVRGFLGQLDIPDPPLSPFRETEPNVGEVDVRARGEAGQTLDRVASTLILRRPDGEHWFVTGAVSGDVQIDTPDPQATVSSPFTVSGRARGFEGTVNARVLDRFDGGGVDSSPAVGTAGGQGLEAFSVDASFVATGTERGVLYVHTDSGVENGIPSFVALPVRLSGDGTGPSAAGAEFGYPPLWPFTTQAEVDAWRQQHAAQGTQPWHLDADATALAFTTGYLGFTEIDQVVGSDVRDREAWISVGYDAGSGPATAAVVHLVRFGPGNDAPWEVVGTRDTDLTLERPSYGSSVSGRVTVGGHITGVDESLRVQVRQASSEAPIGEACCLPAGGQDAPWETTVSFSGATDPALTIVVSTGGHVQGVERFAITAVRP